MAKKTYWYFISFTYRKFFFFLGTGCITLSLDFILYTDIIKVSKAITKINKLKKVVIMYYDLIKVEDEE